MFCAPALIFGGTKGVRSRFHIFRSRTHFRRYRQHRVPFSGFALQDTFSAVRRASGLVFMFCDPRLVCGGSEGVGSRSHLLRSRTSFLRYRGRRVLFSCFALSDSFSVVFRTTGPIFDGTEVVGSYFHVLRFRTRLQRYRVRCVPCSCFVLLESIPAVPRASGPIFIFCDPELIFGGTEGVRSYFNVLRSRTHFRRYRGRRVPFSCLALPGSFSAVPRASRPIFMFCATGYVFGGAEGIGSCFHVLRSRTLFLRYRVCRLSFSCLVRPNSFSSIPTVSGPIIIFCAPGHVFDGVESIRSRFHVLRSQTYFRRFRGRLVSFYCSARPY
jgi:hypothetical protein